MEGNSDLALRRRPACVPCAHHDHRGRGGVSCRSGAGAVVEAVLAHIFYMALLPAAVRFFHYALFDGKLLSLYYSLVAYAVLLAAASLGFRSMRTTQMVTQYRWLYERTSPLTWRERQS